MDQALISKQEASNEVWLILVGQNLMTSSPLSSVRTGTVKLRTRISNGNVKVGLATISKRWSGGKTMIRQAVQDTEDHAQTRHFAYSGL